MQAVRVPIEHLGGWTLEGVFRAEGGRKLLLLASNSTYSVIACGEDGVVDDASGSLAGFGAEALARIGIEPDALASTDEWPRVMHRQEPNGRLPLLPR